MASSLIVRFPGAGQIFSADMGGKAASLIRMSEAGLPVPSGAVLTTRFFDPWFDTIRTSTPWIRLTEVTPQEWTPHCDALKELAQVLPLTAIQREALATLRRDLVGSRAKLCLAVRSSSPDEDLASASFAGGYETRLGVHPNDLEDAIRHCFASTFDVRVLTYKAQHGFDLWSPRIAIIVQRQVDSDVAGVGFSLNPVTNDYDEAVIASNWGLGTSVVEGQVSPDHFVVDKVDRQVVQETLGAKQGSVWLDPGGGTVERGAYRCTDRTLTDAQIDELTAMICRIEDLYGMPVDIEWTYAEGELHILQARPITRYVPLPAEMLTRPGERRRLYADAALSKGMTTNAPISPLGLDSLKSLFSGILEFWVGPMNRNPPPEDALIFFAGGRMYMNYSNMMWLASSPKLARSAAPTDALMAQILASVDDSQYRAAERPSWLSFRLLWIIPRALWRLRGFFWNLLRSFVAPDGAHRTYRQTVGAFESELREQLDGELSLTEFRNRYEPRLAREMFDVMMPALLAGLASPDFMISRKNREMRALSAKLRLGVPGNIVVEMGIAMYRLATRLKPSDFHDLDRLAGRINRGQMPAGFMKEWNDFISGFGWRGPLEMDLASPRYADDARLALRQLSFMAVDDKDFDPEAAHLRQNNERKLAYEELYGRLGPLRRILLRRIYHLIELFSGTRDTPKHVNVLFNYAVRKRVLAEGRRLTQEGRLDAAEDVFGLELDDLKSAEHDASLDLRKIREKRTRFQNKLRAQVRNFPPVIDSRGRILRPLPAENLPGVLAGMPVSSGVATGPVKVLQTPYEKTVEKGDVLVAYTTDPGWTPLFVNAAAIVLEVGGVLQHGAVVAREYGKPCVAGIDRIVDRLQDGQLVEVNGTTGTVRLVSRAPEPEGIGCDHES
jgi:rifampicin phosphotransferase